MPIRLFDHCMIVLNRSVPAVLPSEQCLKRCTSKNITDHYQQMLASCDKPFED